MEAVAFKEKQQALAEIHALEGVEECLILQTCNRIEIFAVSEDEASLGLIKDYFSKRAREHAEEAFKAMETSVDMKLSTIF